MKKRMVLWAAVFLGLLLSGCGTQVPLSGRAFDEYMKSIKPYLQYWEKPGMTVEGRRVDSKECGGLNDSIQFIGTQVVKAAHLPGETENQTETRLRQDWVACMREKGYRYVATTQSK